MIYFDNAATGGRKPDAVQTALSSAVKVCANPGRSGHKLSLACAAQVENCRAALDTFFDGYGFDRVVFTKNCTEGLNAALFGTLRKGDHAVATCMEHNSVLRPLEFLKKQGIITYDICPLRGEGAQSYLQPDDLLSLLKPNTRLVAITAASNVTGYAPDLTKIRKILPENILLLCDGAQGAGHLPLKMKGAGIDLLTIAGHKGMLGIQGSGALLFSERVNPTPLLYGGTGSMSISLDMPDFYPDELEAGTLAFPAISALLEGVRYLTFHQQEIEEKLYSLTEHLIQWLSTRTDYVTYSQPNPCGIVAFRHRSLQSELLAEQLSVKYDIAVRGGLHCAPLMHEALGTLDGGLVRVSFSHYNSIKEIDRLIFALNELAFL